MIHLVDMLVVRALTVSVVENKSWHSNLTFEGNHPEISKIRSNKFGIYPIKTFSYGHIQYEKKLPYGSVFLWSMSFGHDDFSMG